MNIVRNDVDACNATLTLTIDKQDYEEKVDKAIKDYRRKAQMPGFRPGNVPVGLIKKMYGRSILAEEVNKIISESLYNYIKDNKINILGEPISNETIQKPIDFDTDETFEFVFDIGLTPELTINTTAKDKIPYYTIAVTDEMVDEHINMHASRLGQYVPAEKTEENSVIKGEMTEITDSAEPLKVLEALITPKFIKDDKQKKLFVGKKKGAKIKFNPVAAMSNDYEVSSLLNVDRDKVKEYDHDFEYVIKEITNHQSAELDQSLFDKVMGEGTVKSLEEFKQKVKEGIERVYVADSDYRFGIDARDFFIKKNKKAVFPEDFLKRWLRVTNEKMTDEAIEKDFDRMLEYLKWDIIKKLFVEKYEIKIEDKDVREAARQDVLMRFAQYGINNPQDDILNTYVEESLKQKGAVEQFYQQAVEKTVIAKIKENVALNPKEVTMEEFNKLFAEK